MAADLIAERCGKRISRPEGQALVVGAALEGKEVVLAKPQTYMNLSGLAVRQLLKRFELLIEDVIVLVDDVDLPLGSLRVRDRGSAGSHKGLKSIISETRSDRFIRVRMGVMPDRPIGDRADYVLSRFRKTDLETITGMVERAADAVNLILRQSAQAAMNFYNRRSTS
jgi:peptidyl-tRNA hydrolase, PTH1 family